MYSHKELKGLAYILRREVIEMLYSAGSGHIGGSFSIAEIVTVLYFRILNILPQEPLWSKRDRFILSKGHACPILYATLAYRGYFPKEELYTLRKMGSRLEGHPNMKKTPGIDATSGSLGQGLSIGLGMAIGGKLKKEDFHVFVLLGDGEIQEGQIWEAAMAASHYHLDNLIAIVDHNKLQVDGSVEDVMSIQPLADKWKAFGWEVKEVDGHDIRSLTDIFEEAKIQSHSPTVIIAHTIKGKGVSFMENEVDWHGSRAPTKDERDKAICEIDAYLKRLELGDVL